MQAVVVRVRPLAETEHDAGEKRASHRFAKHAQAGEVLAQNACSRLDLERDDRTVLPFEDEIGFSAIVCSPVSAADDLVEPRRLLDQLIHCERLEEMPELLPRGRVEPSQLLRRQPEQTRSDARVEHMQLGRCDRARAERLPPRRQAIEEIDRLEQPGVVL